MDALSPIPSRQTGRRYCLAPGMIPRHRDKLAQSIGNAVGNELVSQETVFNALFETSFFHRKVEEFVTAYTSDLLATVYPSFIDALPAAARAPILDTISALQYRLAEYIAAMLKSEETAAAIARFVDARVNDLLQRRVDATLSDDAMNQVLHFVDERFQQLVNEQGFEQQIDDFIANRLNDLAQRNATLAETFTPETVGFIKDRIDQQVPPIVQHLADIATSQNTRKQIGALIKREVDDYYEQLSLFKKIFISRERINREVDDLVNKTLPNRIEEYLRGPAFEQEAEAFLNETIDNVTARPLNEIIGQLEPEKLKMIQTQVNGSCSRAGPESGIVAAISSNLVDAVERLRPQTLRSMLRRLNPDSEARLKHFLTSGLLNLLTRRIQPEPSTPS